MPTVETAPTTATNTPASAGERRSIPARVRALRRRWGSLPLDFKILWFGFAVVVTLVVIDRFDHATRLNASWLDLSGEQNLLTWFRSLQFGAAAMAAGAVVYLRAGERSAWGPVAAVFAIFSLDDIVMLHERLEGDNTSTAHDLIRYVEPLAAVVMVVAAVHILRRVSTRQRLLLLGAGAMLVLGNTTSGINDLAVFPSFIENSTSDAEELFQLLIGTFALAAAAPLVVVGLRRRFSSG
jgi:hypothetical protein